MRARTAVSLVALALLGSFAASAGADGYGRLFTTAEQRRELDRIRNDPNWGRPPPPPPPAPAEPVVEAEPEPERPSVGQVTFNGVVIRSSGRDVAWINGESVPAGGVSAEGMRVRTRAGGHRARIELPSGSETIELKPGQKIDVDTGKLVEAYERRGAQSAPSAFGAVASPEGPSEAGDPAPPDAPATNEGASGGG